MQSLPFFSRGWFAPILIAHTAALGACWFLVESIYDPIGDLDFWFYVRGYTAIGAVTGFAAWYFARLVARKRATAYGLAYVAAPAYLFLVWLALDKNPLVAALATFAFGFILSISLLAERSIAKGQQA